MRSIGFLAATVCLMLSLAERICDASDDSNSLRIKFVDEDGKPVARVLVGSLVELKEFDPKSGGKWTFTNETEANLNGIAIYRDVVERFKKQRLLYARHAGRHLVSVTEFTDQDLGKELTLTMMPECHCTMRLTSNELDQIGRTMERPHAIVIQNKQQRIWVYPGADLTVHAFLPAGIYEITCNSPQCCRMTKSFEVKPGMRELDIEVMDLPANPLVLLEGKPAPELADMIAWKNSPGVKLSELRGKVVILHFWGWWCLPCLHRGIPELMELQEKFPGDDLVIIGIHTTFDEHDEIDSVAKLDAKLADARRTIWKGKDIRFPVALSRFRKGRYSERAGEDAPSVNCANYGIDGFGTNVLIDRDGNVVGKFHTSRPSDRERVKELLGRK